MKAYIVQASSGSYDSYHDWIHAVYINHELAEAEKNKINAEMEVKRNIPCPFPLDEDGDLINENLPDEEWKLYHKWYIEHQPAREWNGAKVFEYEFGKIYDSNYTLNI